MKLRKLFAAACALAITLGAAGLVRAYSTPPSWSGMIMLNVTFDNGTLDVTNQSSTPVFAFETQSTGAPNYSSRLLGNFDPDKPWRALNNMGFSRILGWYDPNSAKTDGTALKDKIQAYYGADACMWIEVLSQSNGLMTYQAIGKYGVNADNSQNVDPNAHGYAGIFGTNGSSTKWKWDYAMDHNVYAVPWDSIVAGQTYTATYEVYVGDSQGNKIGASTVETWTWQAPAFVPCLVDEGNGLIYDKYLNVTWYQVSSGRLWTDGNNKVNTYIANLSVNGISGWRLPTANKADIENGINNTGELGHLYYNALGNTLSGGLQQTGPFTGLQPGPYWTGTVANGGMMVQYYVLDFNSGVWGVDCGMQSMSDGDYVLAVHDGNIGIFDATPPVVSSFSIPATSTTLAVPIMEFTATDDFSVTGYIATENSTPPDPSAAGWSSSAPSSYTFSYAGSKTLYGFAKDAAGNVSVPASAPVVITLADIAAPVVTSFLVPATASSLTVPITEFTATDDFSVTGYIATENSTPPDPSAAGWSSSAPSSYTFSYAGSKTLYGFAKDAAGNVSVPASAPVIITLSDTTAPKVKAFVMPPKDDTLTVPVTSFTATDNAGVTGYLLTETAVAPGPGAAGWKSTPPTDYTFDSAGTKYVYAWARDVAGNVSSSKNRRIVVDLTDRTRPKVTDFQVPPQSASLTVPVTSFTATDNVGVTGYLLTETPKAPTSTANGWSATVPASYTFYSWGNKHLYAWAKDGAGNISSLKSDRVIVDVGDRIKPEVTDFQVPPQSASLTVPVTSFTATDNVGVTGYLLTETPGTPSFTSAWTNTPPASYTFAKQGKRTVYAWARDAAGNISKSAHQKVTVTTP